MTLAAAVHDSLSSLPNADLLDHVSVMDLFLDLANAAPSESERGLVSDAMKQLPASSLMDRGAVVDTLLDLALASNHTQN